MVVSVPSRGLYFLNGNVIIFVFVTAIVVSVPSRGLYFLNLYFPTEKEIRAEGFRPLSGTVFPKFDFARVKKALTVSVPSRGLYFLNFLTFLKFNIFIVSVPSRGLYFLNSV